MLREAVAVVSGTASVPVIKRRVSGSSPRHFVPSQRAPRLDCLTDWYLTGGSDTTRKRKRRSGRLRSYSLAVERKLTM